MFRRAVDLFTPDEHAILADWAHGSSLKPPPDTTPDDAGDPSRVVFCLDGPSE